MTKKEVDGRLIFKGTNTHLYPSLQQFSYRQKGIALCLEVLMIMPKAATVGAVGCIRMIAPGSILGHAG